LSPEAIFKKRKKYSFEEEGGGGRGVWVGKVR